MILFSRCGCCGVDFCVQGGAGVVGGRMSSYSQSRRTGEIARRRETCAESFKLFLISVSCPFFGGVECNDCISLAFLKTWGVSARYFACVRLVIASSCFNLWMMQSTTWCTSLQILNVPRYFITGMYYHLGGNWSVILKCYTLGWEGQHVFKKWQIKCGGDFLKEKTFFLFNSWKVSQRKNNENNPLSEMWRRGEGGFGSFFIAKKLFFVVVIFKRRNLYLKPVPGTAQFHEIKTVKHNGIVQLYASKLSGEEGKKINLTLK